MPRMSVEPMYIPGRLRTASSPSRTVILEASYVSAGAFSTRGSFLTLAILLTFELCLLLSNAFAQMIQPVDAVGVKNHHRRRQATAEKGIRNHDE